MKCILIEDDAIWRSKNLTTLDELGIFVLDVASSNTEAFKILKKHKPDFILTDILLEKITIFEVFKQVHEATLFPTILLTNSESEFHYNQAKILKNHCYLVKPVHKLTLKSSIESVTRKKIKDTAFEMNSLTIRGKYNEKVIIPFSKIIYLSQQLKYCTIHTTTTRITLRKSLSSIINELNDDFIRVHQSFCINKNYIQNIGIGLQNIKMIGKNEIIPTGITFLSSLKDFLSEDNSQ